MLELTKQLLEGVSREDPVSFLCLVLSSTIELVSLDDNDFSWTSWQDRTEAVSEIQLLLNMLKQNGTTDFAQLAVLFAPTGPLQELSMSSGWGDVYLRLAGLYDEAERLF